LNFFKNKVRKISGKILRKLGKTENPKKGQICPLFLKKERERSCMKKYDFAREKRGKMGIV